MASGLTTVTTHGRMSSFLQEGHQDKQRGGMLLVRFWWQYRFRPRLERIKQRVTRTPSFMSSFDSRVGAIGIHDDQCRTRRGSGYVALAKL